MSESKDIVVRLRSSLHNRDDCREAASEIERLREAVKKFEDAGFAMPDGSPLPKEAWAVTMHPAGWPSNGPIKYCVRRAYRGLFWRDGGERYLGPESLHIDRSEADAACEQINNTEKMRHAAALASAKEGE